MHPEQETTRNGPLPAVVVTAPMRTPVDPELEALLATARAVGAPPFADLTPAAARARVSATRARLPPGPAVARVTDISIPGADGLLVRARRYIPEANREPDGTLVYFHGGGWVVGSVEDSDGLCRTLAVASACEVLSVDYRLAPEHPYPAAVIDADAALAFAAGARPGRPLVLVGDSAGGNLAAVAALRARDAGGPTIALQVLVYPVTQPSTDTASYRQHGGSYLLSADDLRWFWDQYVPDLAVRDSPDASPLLAASLAGLPPALVLVAEYDPLRDEGLAYAQRLADDGVPVTVDRYESMVHGFFPLLGVLTASTTAVSSVGAAVRTAVAGPH